MKASGMIVLALAAFAGAASAAGQERIERGRELFHSTRLGTNGKSCASCHLNGSKLAESSSYDDRELIKVINQCIKEALAGKPPSARSTDMQALVAYIRTIAKP